MAINEAVKVALLIANLPTDLTVSEISNVVSLLRTITTMSLQTADSLLNTLRSVSSGNGSDHPLGASDTTQGGAQLTQTQTLPVSRLSETKGDSSGGNKTNPHVTESKDHLENSNAKDYRFRYKYHHKYKTKYPPDTRHLNFPSQTDEVTEVITSSADHGKTDTTPRQSVQVPQVSSPNSEEKVEENPLVCKCSVPCAIRFPTTVKGEKSKLGPDSQQKLTDMILAGTQGSRSGAVKHHSTLPTQRASVMSQPNKSVQISTGLTQNTGRSGWTKRKPKGAAKQSGLNSTLGTVGSAMDFTSGATRASPRFNRKTTHAEQTKFVR